MAGTALRDIFYLLETTRTRQVRLMAADRTLREMERLPSHLIEDVNARGLPLDHHAETAEQTIAPSFKKAYDSYKIYSFD